MRYCNEGGILHQWMHRPGGGKRCAKCGMVLHCWCRHTIDDHDQNEEDQPCDRCRCDGFKEQWSSIRRRLDRQYQARSSPIWADSKRPGKEQT